MNNPPAGTNKNEPQVTLGEFQKLIRQHFYEHDSSRGTPGTFLWFMEEIGELATALASGDQPQKAEEFADVLAWLCTLANINDIDLEKAVCEKYVLNMKDGWK